MKVLHLATSQRGGAGIAASRSVESLRRRGVDAVLWASDDGPNGLRIRSVCAERWRTRFENLPLRFYRNRRLFSAWSNNYLPSGLAAMINQFRPNVVHMHWLGGGFMHLAEIESITSPVVWTMHDAWGITGGCHYPSDCERFMDQCGECPQLGSNRRHDLSWFNLRSKRRWVDRVAAVISPSHWLASLARSSGHFPESRLHVIPNGVDPDVFAPRDRTRARVELGLPLNEIILVAGAHDLREVRKGVHLLREAVEILVYRGFSNFSIVLFGASASETIKPGWPCSVTRLGPVDGESKLAQILSAADVCVLPSLQDNLPNIAVEAQACGCPVVGFDSGGLAEIIEINQTGSLSPNLTAEGLAIVLRDWLKCAHEKDVTNLSRVRFMQQFTLAKHGERLESLYSAL